MKNLSRLLWFLIAAIWFVPVAASGEAFDPNRGANFAAGFLTDKAKSRQMVSSKRESSSALPALTFVAASHVEPGGLILPTALIPPAPVDYYNDTFYKHFGFVHGLFALAISYVHVNDIGGARTDEWRTHPTVTNAFHQFTTRARWLCSSDGVIEIEYLKKHYAGARVLWTRPLEGASVRDRLVQAITGLIVLKSELAALGQNEGLPQDHSWQLPAVGSTKHTFNKSWVNETVPYIVMSFAQGVQKEYGLLTRDTSQLDALWNALHHEGVYDQVATNVATLMVGRSKFAQDIAKYHVDGRVKLYAHDRDFDGRAAGFDGQDRKPNCVTG